MRKIRLYILKLGLLIVACMIANIALGILLPIGLVYLWYIIVLVGVGYATFLLIKKRYWYALLSVVIVGILSWMRRGETHFLQVKTTQLHLGFPAKFVVVSDLHLGAYKGEKYLQMIVDKINAQTGANAVFIVGDWVYGENRTSLQSMLQPLKQVKYPIYTVFGNHDMIPLGDGAAQQLRKIFPDLGITLLENKETILELSGSRIRLFGLGDERAGDAQVSILSGIQQADNVVVLAHDPDTIMRYGQTGTGESWETHRHSFLHKAPYVTGWLATTPVDITFAGHTHASQVRLFGITNTLTPTKYRWPRDGWYSDLKLFITRGVGETIVPVRLFNRVQIDVIESY